MTDVLEEGRGVVRGDRDKAYGMIEDSFGRTAGLWSSYLDHKISPMDVAMMMVLLKIGRERYKHKRDNLVDMAGYVLCAEDLWERLLETESDESLQQIKVGGTIS